MARHDTEPTQENNVRSNRFAALGLALGLLAVAQVQAAIPIQDGITYTLPGYLSIHHHQAGAGNMPRLAVFLSAHAGGLQPPGLVGRQDIELIQGSLVQNLFSVARRFGPRTRVIVQGTGTRQGQIAAATIEEDSRVHEAATGAPVRPHRFTVTGRVVARPQFGTPPPDESWWEPRPVAGARVTVRSAGGPAGGAAASAWQTTTVTGADGRFRVRAIPVRFVQIILERELHATETRTLDLARTGSLGTVELHYNGPPVPAPPPPSNP
jgi:hypothetical protein